MTPFVHQGVWRGGGGVIVVIRLACWCVVHTSVRQGRLLGIVGVVSACFWRGGGGLIVLDQTTTVLITGNQRFKSLFVDVPTNYYLHSVHFN